MIELEKAHDLEIAWAAGLFEGEGCFTTSSKNSRGYSYRNWVCFLGSTDEDIVKRFFQIVGVGRIYEQTKHRNGLSLGTKPFFRWQTQSRNDFRFIAKIFTPYLGERRLARVTELLAEIEAHEALPRGQRGLGLAYD